MSPEGTQIAVNKLTVTFPRGSVDKQIKVLVFGEQWDAALGKQGYSVSNSWTTFARPVSITIRHSVNAKVPLTMGRFDMESRFPIALDDCVKDLERQQVTCTTRVGGLFGLFRF